MEGLSLEQPKAIQSASKKTEYSDLSGIFLYEHQSGKSSMYLQQFLDGFHGMLQCDGCQSYNKVVEIQILCCSAHARRKFYEALTVEKKKNIKFLDINSLEERQKKRIEGKCLSGKTFLPGTER